MVQQAAFLVQRYTVGQLNLLGNYIKPFGVVKLLGVLRQKGRSHIQAIQPYLVGINFLMPVASRLRFGMITHLLNMQFNGIAILLLTGTLVQGNNIFSRIDAIDVVIGLLIMLDRKSVV